MTHYDFEDEKIRRLVESHDPQEAFTIGGDTKIRCDTDGETWPCRAVKSFREWKLAQEKLERQKMKEFLEGNRGLR